MVKSVDAGQLTFTTDLKVALRGGGDRSHFHAAAAEIGDALENYAVVVSRTPDPRVRRPAARTRS